jgi:hypothetical protein
LRLRATSISSNGNSGSRGLSVVCQPTMIKSACYSSATPWSPGTPGEYRVERDFEQGVGLLRRGRIHVTRCVDVGCRSGAVRTAPVFARGDQGRIECWPRTALDTSRIQRTSAQWFGRRALFQSLRASRRATSPRHDAMPSHTPATMATTLPIQYEPNRPIAPSTTITTATTICHRRRVLAAEFGGGLFDILSPSTMRAGSLV